MASSTPQATVIDLTLRLPLDVHYVIHYGRIQILGAWVVVRGPKTDTANPPSLEVTALLSPDDLVELVNQIEDIENYFLDMERGDPYGDHTDYRVHAWEVDV